VKERRKEKWGVDGKKEIEGPAVDNKAARQLIAGL
jgi:hypothetical protein